MHHKTHRIKTWKPFFQDVLDGRKPFDFRKNDRDFKVDDDIVHIEYDPETQAETGRHCNTTIIYILQGGQFGIPDGYVLFTQVTASQSDFIRQYHHIANDILPEYEKTLSHRVGGDIIDRLSHVLRSLQDTATNSVYKAKHYLDDAKTQFKALEIILQGITGQGNHSEKRVIANHVISMLRTMVDKIDHTEFDFSQGVYERYNFYRSQSPEGKLMEKYKLLKYAHENLQVKFKDFNERVPDQYKVDDLPF
jgi:hypothetical protein